MHTHRLTWTTKILLKVNGFTQLWSPILLKCTRRWNRSMFGFQEADSGEEKGGSDGGVMPQRRFVSPLIINKIQRSRHVVTHLLFYGCWSAPFPESVLRKTNIPQFICQSEQKASSSFLAWSRESNTSLKKKKREGNGAWRYVFELFCWNMVKCSIKLGVFGDQHASIVIYPPC